MCIRDSVYHAAGIRSLARVFGTAITRELLMLGRRVALERAEAAGAAIEVVAPEDLDGACERMIADLQASNPGALAGHRDLLRALDDHWLTDDDLRAHEARRQQAYRNLDTRGAKKALLGDD